MKVKDAMQTEETHFKKIRRMRNIEKFSLWSLTSLFQCGLTKHKIQHSSCPFALAYSDMK